MDSGLNPQPENAELLQAEIDRLHALVAELLLQNHHLRSQGLSDDNRQPATTSNHRMSDPAQSTT